MEDLKGHSIEAVNKAFLEWRRTQEGLPTCAGVLKILDRHAQEKNRGEKRYADFNGDWPAYKKYLDSRALLSQKLSA